jgi:ribosomal protein S18 acetylase RimI-like enzyme
MLYNTADMEIRALTAADVDLFREVRLRALREHPDTFGLSADEFARRPISEVASRLANESQHPDSFTLGAFIDERLVGIMGMQRDDGEKHCHNGFVWGVYVVPEARGRGVARAMMVETIERARRVEGLMKLYLAVTTFNTTARALYISLGFEVYGLEPYAMKLADRRIDEELMLFWLHPPGER